MHISSDLGDGPVNWTRHRDWRRENRVQILLIDKAFLQNAGSAQGSVRTVQPGAEAVQDEKQIKASRGQPSMNIVRRIYSSS